MRITTTADWNICCPLRDDSVRGSKFRTRGGPMPRRRDGSFRKVIAAPPPGASRPLIHIALRATLRLKDEGGIPMLVSQILKSKGDLVFTASPQETLGAVAALLHSR